MKTFNLKNISTILSIILINIGAGFLLNYLFFDDNTYFIMFSLGFVFLSIIVVNMVANKMGYKLDLFINDIDDNKFLLLNNIYLSCMFSIPITFVVSVLL